MRVTRVNSFAIGAKERQGEVIFQCAAEPSRAVLFGCALERLSSGEMVLLATDACQVDRTDFSSFKKQQTMVVPNRLALPLYHDAYHHHPQPPVPQFQPQSHSTSESQKYRKALCLHSLTCQDMVFVCHHRTPPPLDSHNTTVRSCCAAPHRAKRAAASSVSGSHR